MMKVKISRDDAVLPKKAHPTDAGFDLTATHAIKTVGDVTFYGTGLSVQAPEGIYFQLFPRSSVSKSGYMLANSVGVIDNGYQGELIIAMRKIDKAAEDFVLPQRLAQLVPFHMVPLETEVVEDFDLETDRGSGGFGSTGTSS